MKEVARDERTILVENKSFSLGYIFMGFALLFDIMYRSFKFGQSSIDLFAIIVMSGLISTIYQLKNKILNKGWVKTITIAIFVAIFTSILFQTIK